MVDGEHMLNNLNISFLRHSEINECFTEKIIRLKQQHWTYSNESQIDWINANIKRNDYHILITDTNANILAYMNLVNRKVNNVEILGIGNVCVDKNVSGDGVGTLLMNVSKFYARQLSLDLILLCKENLVDFYKKCGFYLYQGNAYIAGAIFNNSVFTLRNDYNFINEMYIDKDF